MSKPKVALILIFVILFVIIIMQNLNSITFHLLWWNFEMSVFTIPIIAIVSFLIGYFIAKITGSAKDKKEMD